MNHQISSTPPATATTLESKPQEVQAENQAVEQTDNLQEKATARVNWEILLKCLNFLLSLQYLVLSVGSAVLVHQAYWRGGKILREMFRADSRPPSFLIPVWAHIPDRLPFGSWLDHMYVVCIALAVIWMADYLCAFELCLKGQRRECKVFLVLIVITIIAQSIVLSQVSNTSKSFHMEAIYVAVNELASSYKIVGINDVTVAMNMMMLQGQCCGMEGPYDFMASDLSVNLQDKDNPYGDIVLRDNSPEWLKSYKVPVLMVNYSKVFKVPPACCKEQVFDVDQSMKRFESVSLCASSWKPSSLNIQGCYIELFDGYVATGATGVLLALVYVVEVLQFMLVLLVHMIVPSQTSPEVASQPSVLQEGENDETRLLAEGNMAEDNLSEGSTQV